jgi:hypothetical protein
MFQLPGVFVGTTPAGFPCVLSTVRARAVPEIKQFDIIDKMRYPERIVHASPRAAQALTGTASSAESSDYRRRAFPMGMGRTIGRDAARAAMIHRRGLSVRKLKLKRLNPSQRGLAILNLVLSRFKGCVGRWSFSNCLSCCSRSAPSVSESDDFEGMRAVRIERAPIILRLATFERRIGQWEGDWDDTAKRNSRSQLSPSAALSPSHRAEQLAMNCPTEFAKQIQKRSHRILSALLFGSIVTLSKRMAVIEGRNALENLVLFQKYNLKDSHTNSWQREMDLVERKGGALSLE